MFSLPRVFACTTPALVAACLLAGPAEAQRAEPDWGQFVRSATCNDFKKFARRYPNSVHAAEAKTRADQCKANKKRRASQRDQELLRLSRIRSSYNTSR